eukprot:scaffold14749_cov126-Isochrysis_galbana.AAC.4
MARRRRKLLVGQASASQPQLEVSAGAVGAILGRPSGRRVGRGSGRGREWQWLYNTGRGGGWVMRIRGGTTPVRVGRTQSPLVCARLCSRLSARAGCTPQVTTGQL